VTRRLPLVLALLASGSCYTIGDLYEFRNIQVPVFDNATERHTEEFDLTPIVSREMAARGLRVNSPDAPVVLKGRITDIKTPTVVTQQQNTEVVGSLAVRVEIRLVNRDNRELWKDERTETVSFTSFRGQTIDTARMEAYNRIARWVVAHFEKEW
jgi:hypothetical protein